MMTSTSRGSGSRIVPGGADLRGGLAWLARLTLLALFAVLVACSPGVSPLDRTGAPPNSDPPPIDDGGDLLTGPEDIEPVDADGDGYPEDTDCDDEDRLVHPGAVEVCDGVDSDCDGSAPIDEADADGDGFRVCAGDCDDRTAAANPSLAEVCGDGLDNDCDGTRNGCGLLGVIPLTDADLTLLGEAAGSKAGASVAGVGDVDGDGFDDLLIGAPGDGIRFTHGGSAHLVLGPLEGTYSLADADATYVGEHYAALAGAHVAAAGDLDGDGLPELLVGALGSDDAGPYAGASYVVRATAMGAQSLALAAAKLVSEAYFYDNAAVVAVGGDLNGDGTTDLIVGAPGYGPDYRADGKVYLLHGPVTGDRDLASADATIHDVGEFCAAGASVAGVGDVNGDGFDDLLVGAPNCRAEDGSDPYRGAAWLFFGPILHDLTPADADARIQGLAAGDKAGRVVAAAGDLNRDGFDDFLVTAPQPNTGAGLVWIVHGPVSGLLTPGDAAATFSGVAFNDKAGISAAIAGDVDGDGYDDLVVGARGYSDGAIGRGAAYLIYGPLAGARSLAEADAIFVGEFVGDAAGCSVAAAGDVNGDGFADLLIGAELRNGAGADAGAAYVVYGRPGF